MIIDRPTPATQNGLENVIRGWPNWMLCKAFKKHKLCSSWRVQKAYWVGIAKSFADFCTCFSLVITPHNMSVSILFVCTATHVPWRTGRTKVALVELPTVNMVGFFFCTPFPRRILAWSFVVPRSHFHPPKALKSYIYIYVIHLKEGNNWPTHTCHTKWTWKCDPQLTEMDVL